MNEEINWASLPFGYYPTDYNVRCTYRDGKWGEIEVSDSENVSLHIAATALHYGQEIFEGHSAAKTARYAFSASRKTPNVSVSLPKGCLWSPYPKIYSAKCV